MCCLRTAVFGSAAESTSPAGLSSRYPCATAHFITAPMRWRTRPAVTRLVDQIGSSTAMTSAVVTASTRFRARRGRT